MNSFCQQLLIEKKYRCAISLTSFLVETREYPFQTLKHHFHGITGNSELPEPVRPAARHRCRAEVVTFRLPRRYAATITVQMLQKHVIV